MTPEAIHDFLEKEKNLTAVKVELKKRSPVMGRFIKSNDYNDLKEKNFWRILRESDFAEWEAKQDNNLLRMFNGSEFSRITKVS